MLELQQKLIPSDWWLSPDEQMVCMNVYILYVVRYTVQTATILYRTIFDKSYMDGWNHINVYFVKLNYTLNSWMVIKFIFHIYFDDTVNVVVFNIENNYHNIKFFIFTSFFLCLPLNTWAHIHRTNIQITRRKIINERREENW